MKSSGPRCWSVPVPAGKLQRHSNLEKLTLGGGGLDDERLEKAANVRRTRDPNNRRRVIVELIPENVSKIAGYFEPIAKETMGRFSSYAEEQLRFLLDFARGNNTAMPDVIRQVQAMP